MSRFASSQFLLCLLLTEADEPVAAVMVRGVRRAGWSVLLAATAALRLKADSDPHVVQLALDLTGMGGRCRPAWQGSCKGIALSNRGASALAGGAHDYLMWRQWSCVRCWRGLRRCSAAGLLRQNQRGPAPP